MQPADRFKLGGKLLAVGASVALLVKLYFFVSSLFLLSNPNYPFSLANRIIGFLAGNWLSSLLAPGSIGGTTFEFQWSSLFFVPHATVFMIFFLWLAIKTIRGRFNIKLIPLMSVLGLWLLVGLLDVYVTGGFQFSKLDFWAVILPILINHLATLAIISGIGLIIFSYKQISVVDEVPWTGDMTLSYILFSFEGRINRAKYWGYGILLAIIPWIGIIIDFSTTKKVGAGYIMGLLITLWPLLALNVKRCHDRNKSGWFYLIALIPFVGIWYLVETGFLKGTEGDNKYGHDPLDSITDARPKEIGSMEEILPEEIKCPNCSEILELDEEERRNKKFTCPACGKSLDMNEQNIA